MYVSACMRCLYLHACRYCGCIYDVCMYVGIVGVCTDLRNIRRRSLAPHAGINLFVAGAVMNAGACIHIHYISRDID